MILLFRRPILDYAQRRRLATTSVLRHVLIHEIGQHFGCPTRPWRGLPANSAGSGPGTVTRNIAQALDLPLQDIILFDRIKAAFRRERTAIQAEAIYGEGLSGKKCMGLEELHQPVARWGLEPGQGDVWAELASVSPQTKTRYRRVDFPVQMYKCRIATQSNPQLTWLLQAKNANPEGLKFKRRFPQGAQRVVNVYDSPAINLANEPQRQV